MAKKKIGNYKFKPGIGYTENLFPNAYALLNANKAFLQAETGQFITSRVSDATAFQADLISLVDDLEQEIVLGTTATQRLWGQIENQKNTNQKLTRKRTLTRLKTALAALSNVTSTYQTAMENAIDEIIDIADNGFTSATALVTSERTGETELNIGYAVTQIKNNRAFMIAEVKAFMNVDTPGNTVTTAATFETNLGLLLDCITQDISTTANNLTKTVNEEIYVLTAPADRSLLGDGLTRLATVIKQIVEKSTVIRTTGNSLTQSTTGTVSSTVLGDRSRQHVLDTQTVVANGTVASLPSPVYPNYSDEPAAGQAAATDLENNKTTVATSVNGFYNYTFNQAKCERDTGLILNAYLFDLRYGGNMKTYNYASKYWEGDVAQVDGTRYPETDTHSWLTVLIKDFVLNKTTYPNEQTATTQTITGTDAEAGADTPIVDLGSLVVTTIAGGLSARPTFVDTGAGYIKFPGNYDSSDILLITNTTNNEVIYSFNDVNAGGVTELATAFVSTNDVAYKDDPDFPKYLQTTDAITKVYLNKNTSTQLNVDRLQIYVDTDELIIRPFEFGTDAIERNRTAEPQSMLDADFEYGLQPTKWSAIATMRGYPSVYEIPGTETSVISVVSDSSAGTAGVGSSLITVTTAGAHGFELGDAVTIKGLKQDIQGYSRAEGAFIIIAVPNAVSFQYYAKAKVGVSGNVNIEAEATQLRQAGFYTGASIGVPAFSVESNGSSGILRPALTVALGEDVIPFTVQSGGAPEVGAPMTASSGIALGTQVTGKVGTGGIAVTPVVTADYGPGTTDIDVQNATGIQQNMAANKGDGTPTLVNTVVGTTITFSDAITSDVKGNYVQYAGISGQNVVSLGYGASLSISRAAGNYSLVEIVNSGQDYNVNDILLIQGEFLGGVTPTNDCTITVDTVDTGGEILTLTLAGNAFNGTGNFGNVTGAYQNGQGNGGLWNLGYASNVYNSVTLSNPSFPSQSGTVSGGSGTGVLLDFVITNNSYAVTVDPADAGVTGYSVYDIIEVAGNNLGGTSPNNDAQVTVVSVDSNGYPTGVSVTGNGANATNNFINVTFSTNNSGIGANLNIGTDGTTYTPTFTVTGTGFAVNDTVTVLGTQVGGASPLNDITITIDTVDTGGEILTFTTSGTAVNTHSYTGIGNGVNLVGSGAGFDVVIDGLTETYLVTVATAGNNYAPNQTVVLPGTSFGGEAGTNDLTLTITDVSNDSTLTAGGILTVNVAGTAVKSTSGYKVADRLKVNGSSFPGGADTTNDAIIEITGVDSGGGITNFATTGTAPNGIETYTAVTGTASASGTSATFDVTRTGAVYTAVLNGAGANFVQNETVTILGTDLGGATTANDCTITVDSVDGSGTILTLTPTGTAANVGALNNTSASSIVGNGATFDVALAGGSYTTTVSQAGQEYYTGQKFIVTGNLLAGGTPTNDLTITINGVNASGGITAIGSVGTASTDVGSFPNVTANTASATGNGLSIDVLRDGTAADSSVGTYTFSISNPGSNYNIGDKIKIGGELLGGNSAIHDVEVLVDSIDSAGAVVTFTATGDAFAGTSFDLYSTVTIDTPTTAQLATTLDISFSALATLRINFDSAHGLVPGDTFITTVDSDDGSNNHDLAAGSFIATTIPSSTSLTFTARAAGAIDAASDNINGTVYPRPDSFFIHRPFDGGVQLGTGGPQHGAQAIRQSKKYIRYQSGKGIMYTTGALFAPSYDLRTVTSSGIETGSTITVTCDDNDHGLQIGARVKLIGIETVGYNGTYTVNDVLDERTFEVINTLNRLGGTSAILSFGAQMSTFQWHGATVRSGVFDDQNGIYWEYDGTNLLCCQRTSTKQISGTGAITPDTNTVTGTNTRFRDQLKAGDRIVIRGMTHVISGIATQTSMTVTPDYRGVNAAVGTKICLVADKKVRQTDWNLDRLDGTGPSGYDFDPAKMQMIGIEYSWYGAGFIDFMVRGADGNFVYAHRIRNSNINTEAYMRSGNLPVRYEITNEGQNGKLASTIDATQSTIPLTDVSFFPTSGTVYIDNELISFTGTDTTTNSITGCTRAATLTNFQAGAARSYTAGAGASHDARTGVILISNTCTPLISHWGSAFITDGGFDEDRGYIFSYTEQALTVTNVRQTAFMIRLAPSVSNAIIGDLGDRELLNRAQLLLSSLEVTSEANSTGSIVIEGILNPQNYPKNPALISWTGLSGLAQGGQPSFAQIASGGGITWSTGASSTTTNITAQAGVNAVLDSGLYRSRNGSRYLYVNASDYRSTFGTESTDPVLGKTISGSNIRANTRVDGGYIASSGNYGYLFLSQTLSGNINQNGSNAMTIISHGTLENANFAFIQKASWEASGGRDGTAVASSSSSPTWPANTVINKIELVDFAGTEYYYIEFNNAASGNLSAGSGTITLEFISPPYGQPGETVLSFIAQPGARADLDLSQLKELTNTTLGGRGTFPNGPDVLAINVFKTTGTDVEANIILRWSEAQA